MDVNGMSSHNDTLAELRELIGTEIPNGRQTLQKTHSDLESVAAYCEANYLQVSFLYNIEIFRSICLVLGLTGTEASKCTGSVGI